MTNRKWLVKAYVDNHSVTRIAAAFENKLTAEKLLNRGFNKISDNLWKDKLGQKFYIEQEAEK